MRRRVSHLLAILRLPLRTGTRIMHQASYRALRLRGSGGVFKQRGVRREANGRQRREFVEVIENPVLNSPFREPTKHFRFSDEGVTSEIVESRRVSSYFIPIPKPKKKGSQLAFDT